MTQKNGNAKEPMDCGNELTPTVYVICFSHPVILLTTFLNEEKVLSKSKSVETIVPFVTAIISRRMLF